MLKGISALLMATALITCAVADDKREFGKTNTDALLGLELGSMNIDAQNDLGQSYTKNGVLDFGIRLGAQTEDYRFLGIYHILEDYTNANDKVTNQMLTLHFDYMFWRWDLGSNVDLKPFIGVNGGYQEYKYSTVKDDGYTYGVETGLILGLDIVDIDLGIRYMGTEIDMVNDMFNIYLGINLKI